MSIAPTPSNAAHLLRRAGWGGRSEEIQRVVDDGLPSSVERLFDRSSAPQLAEPLHESGLIPYEAEAVWGWFIKNCAESATPGIERLLWFWHGHFATSLEKVEMVDLMVRQFLTLRRYGLGRFDSLLLAVAHDPAMILWLDLETSIVGRPNENFARELLELFTLGASNGYTQTDVVEAARAFTGHGLDYDRYERPVGARLVAPLHDFGTKTFLGRSGPLDGTDIIEIITERPACHRFLAQRLWLRHAGTPPPDDVIDDLAAAFARDLQVADLVQAMFTHPRFYDDDVKQGLVAQPVEIAVRTVRAFELSVPDLTVESLVDLEDRFEADRIEPGEIHPGQLTDWLATMGQLPMLPPNVGGWPHNDAWLDSNRAAGRLLAGTQLGHFLLEAEVPAVDDLRRAAGRGAAALTAELMERFGRTEWSSDTEAFIGSALGRSGAADGPGPDADDQHDAALAGAIAAAFTSPEVTLA